MVDMDLIKMKAGMRDEYIKKHGEPEFFTFSTATPPNSFYKICPCTTGVVCEEHKTNIKIDAPTI